MDKLLNVKLFCVLPKSGQMERLSLQDVNMTVVRRELEKDDMALGGTALVLDGMGLGMDGKGREMGDTVLVRDGKA